MVWKMVIWECIEVDGKILVDTSVSINAPTIQPTGCSVGTKQGFSIVQFAGTSGLLRYHTD